jgi:hypothetical protein
VSSIQDQTLNDLQKEIEARQGLLDGQIRNLQSRRTLLFLLISLASIVWLVLLSIPRLRELIAALLLLPLAALAVYGWLVILKLVPLDRSY